MSKAADTFNDNYMPRDIDIFTEIVADICEELGLKLDCCSWLMDVGNIQIYYLGRNKCYVTVPEEEEVLYCIDLADPKSISILRHHIKTYARGNI